MLDQIEFADVIVVSKASIFLGQTHHIAYRPHRNNNNYMPGGFAAIRDNWNGLCSYTARANGNYALCNIPTNSHSWQSTSCARLRRALRRMPCRRRTVCTSG